ncbi:hypothetical protein Tco_0706049 [Tanacetum coccineum]|uniref:DUF1985 domain-containing protein n=1 Tax=Tanacetum coccineum TaxID=301880 RepID=A0ABQ4Y7V6_9ASTR
MEDPNITMEEYIRLKEEKARQHGKVYNWETAKFGKICSLNNNEIDFRISFGKSGDEDYTVVFDKNSFSFKILSSNDLKTDSENDNEKVNMPSFPSPEPKVSCFDDLDYFKDFENEFPAIVYNDALTSKLEFLTEPTLCPQHIDEFDLKDETSLSKYDEEEQNILYFNDLFPFNIIYPDNLKSDKDNDDNKIDIIQSSGGNINTQGSNKLLEESHDKINKVFIMEDFIMELNDDIVAWNYLVNVMLFNLIKNLYVPFGILFDPKRYYKDGVYTRMLRRPRRQVNRVHILDFEGLTLDMRHDLAERTRMVYTMDDGQEVFMSHAWRRLFDIRAPLVHEFILEFFSTCRIVDEMGLDADAKVLYLLAQYLFKYVEGRKSGARLSGEHFIVRLAHHFGLVSDDGLRRLSIVTCELPLIDMGELVKLNICMEIGDDWTWVAHGTERQPVATAAALRGAEDALNIDKDAQAVPTPKHAPPPPPPATGRTMSQRLGRLEEEIQGLRQDVRSLRGLVERSMTDQGRFSTWMISYMTQLMEASGRTYQAFDGTF